MNCQDIIPMQKILVHKYEEPNHNINAFSNLLYCDHWTWPSSSISQNPLPKTKNSQPKGSLKCQILKWFEQLEGNSKCAYTVIKNPNFLFAFLMALKNWDSGMLYHIYQKRSISNYVSAQIQLKTFQSVIQHLRIAWFDDPVLYFEINHSPNQGLFSSFLDWADELTNSKIFQYAHKTKNKSDPDDNLLWFSSQSFNGLPEWILNQFEKVIIKNYFDQQGFDAELYDKIQRLKKGLTNKHKEVSIQKQIQKLLAMNIQQALRCSSAEIGAYQTKLKSYQNQYYQEMALLMDEQDDVGNEEQIGQKKKKKKNRNKKQKNKNKMGITAIGEQFLQEEVSEMANQSVRFQGKANETGNRDGCVIIGQQFYNGADKQNVEESRHQIISSSQEDLDKISIYSELESTQSICSSQLDNLYSINETPANKSVKSLYQCDERSIECESKFSCKIWKDDNCRINYVSLKNRGCKSQALSCSKQKNIISVVKNNNHNVVKEQQNHKTVIREKEDSHTKKYLYRETENQQQIVFDEEQLKKQQQEEKTSPTECKKKKRKNKNNSIIRDLSNKMSVSLVSRQLNHFVDALSTQTNNLYDHKRVAFEKSRFFIQSIFPHTQAMLFGSNAVGLSLPSSDIDIMLFNLPCATKEQAIQILAHLSVQINTMGWIVSCSAYLNAKVPVIKLEVDPSINYLMTKRKCDYLMMNPMYDPAYLSHLQLKSTKKEQNSNRKSSQYSSYSTGYGYTVDTASNSQFLNRYCYEEETQHSNSKIIKVDLSVNLNDEGNLGAQSTDLMKNWMNTYPKIHRVILAIKYILAQKGYSSNFRGGVGSYCLFVMVAAYIKQYPQIYQLEDGQLFLSILKFYGQEFPNQLKSIRMISPDPEFIPEQNSQPLTCFISIEQTQKYIGYNQNSEHPQYLQSLKDNPLRIFDPINSRIMSGSCQLFPQIKAEFRRVYKELKEIQYQVQKQVELTVNKAEGSKMLENKKSIDKWLNKYEVRRGFQIKKVFDGQY